jgi:hypothetical protein
MPRGMRGGVLMNVVLGARPVRRALGLIAGTWLVLAAPAALAALSVSLSDGTSDDVHVSQPYIGPQALQGGYVQWVVRIASDDGAQRIALKDTLPDCMRLLALQPPPTSGPIHGMGADPRAGERREVMFDPGQPDALVSVEGNTILIQNIDVPAQGELRVTYWASIVSKSHVLAGNETPTAAGAGVLVEDQGRTLPSRTLASRTAGVGLDGGTLGASRDDREIVGLRENARRSYRERPIECSSCCNQVKVVDEEARLYLSDTPHEGAATCQPGLTGFEVLVPGAPIPAIR